MVQVLYWVLGAFVLFYGLSPALVRLSTTLSASPDYRPLNTVDAPTGVAEYLVAAAREMESIGFQATAYLAAQASNNVRTYLLMLIHPQNRDVATVIVMYTPTAGNEDGISAHGWKPSTRYTEFCTEYEDGFTVDTFNAPTLPSFKTTPMEVKARVPSVKDPGEMYRIHQFVLARCGRQGSKVIYEPADVLAYRERVGRQSYEQQVRFGRLYLDPLLNAYRPTWWGAYLMTWGMLWPVSVFRRMQMRSAERRLLAQFRAAGSRVARA